MKRLGVHAESDIGLLRDHRVSVAGLEQRQHRLAAVGGDLQGTALETGGPEVELLDWLESQVLATPLRRFVSARHADVDVVDGQRATAWRITGDGHGAWIEVALGATYRITTVGLVPGYAKIDACDGANRFTQNRRIREVRWIIGPESFTQRVDPDLPEMQTLRLPQPISAQSVRLEIVSTTADGGRDFTAISDVEIAGG